MLIFALWLVTAAYADRIAVYPNIQSCALAAVAVQQQIDIRPRPMLGRMICVPFGVAPVSAPGLGM